MLDAERPDAMAMDCAEPSQYRRVPVEHGDDAAVPRQIRGQAFHEGT